MKARRAPCGELEIENDGHDLDIRREMIEDDYMRVL